MTTPNRGPIDNFLESLNLKVGPEPQPEKASQNLGVSVVFARSDGLYPVVVHLVVLDRGVTSKGLEGRLLSGQWTFQAKSLEEFCSFYESAIFENFGEEYHPEEGIRYHRDPQQSMPILPHQNVVSYRLVPRLDDPRGVKLLRVVRMATDTVHASYKPNNA